MKKNIIDILIIIGLLIGFYFLFSWLYEDTKLEPIWTFRPEKKIVTYEEREKQKAIQSDRDANLYNEALKEKDSSLCESIIDTLEKTRCFDMVGATLALDTLDPEKCSSLSSPDMITLCRDNITYRSATQKNDISLCKTISLENIRNNCIEEREQDLIDTLSRSGSLSREQCDLLESPDIQKKCESLIVVRDDSMTYRNAIQSQEIASCDAIVDETLKVQCRDILFLSQAGEISDIALCENIRDETKREVCRSNIERKTDALKFQELIHSGTLSQCQTLRTQEFQKQCHDMILIRTIRESGDIEKCDRLYNTGMIDRCKKTGGK